MTSKLELQMLNNEKERLVNQCQLLEAKLTDLKELAILNEQQLE